MTSEAQKTKAGQVCSRDATVTTKSPRTQQLPTCAMAQLLATPRCALSNLHNAASRGRRCAQRSAPPAGTDGSASGHRMPRRAALTGAGAALTASVTAGVAGGDASAASASAASANTTPLMDAVRLASAATGESSSLVAFEDAKVRIPQTDQRPSQAVPVGIWYAVATTVATTAAYASTSSRQPVVYPHTISVVGPDGYCSPRHSGFHLSSNATLMTCQATSAMPNRAPGTLTAPLRLLAALTPLARCGF
jgi:hypothetical protein